VFLVEEVSHYETRDTGSDDGDSHDCLCSPFAADHQRVAWKASSARTRALAWLTTGCG
jgi:hypothetical protein